MWSKRLLGSVGVGQTSDSYAIILGFKTPSPSCRIPSFSHNEYLTAYGEHYTRVTVRFTNDDSANSISAHIARIQSDANLIEEHVRVQMHVARADTPGDIVMATSPGNTVSVSMTVRRVLPELRSLDLKCLSSNGDSSCPPALIQVLSGLALERITHIRCGQGLMPVWHKDLCPRWQTLEVLHLCSCGLTSLPPLLGTLANLRELHADNNLLTAVPAQLGRCSKLEVLSLEGNQLVAPVLTLGSALNLRSLRLMGNPLEYLPELGLYPALRQLSLANVRVDADADFTAWTVEVLAAGSYISRAHKLAPLCAVIFRHSSTQHPLLAGALAQLVSHDESNCTYIANLEGAIQQIVIMGLSDNDIVVEQACQIIGHLGRHSPAAAAVMLANDVGATLERLVISHSHRSKVCGLRELAALALSSEDIAAQLLTPPLLSGLLESSNSGPPDVQALALEALGNLAFHRPHAKNLQSTDSLLPLLVQLASSGAIRDEDVYEQRARMAAIRALAILGENEEVRRAVGRPSVEGRGIRILAMDGGGIKGLATLRMLWQLQHRCGRKIHEMFDLVCGTSTGGILAAALAIQCVSLTECEDIYKVLGAKVFSRPAATNAEMESWLERASRVYKQSQQSVRAAVYGCKHDSAVFEVLLKEYCKFDPALNLIGDLCIDTACLPIPKCFVVSTLASTTPAAPFVLRNYEHSAAGADIAAKLGACPRGSSAFSVWQAVRASSAAPYYLDDFAHRGDRYQDGAATANNPAALAVAEARALWPDSPIDVLISLGSGKTAPRARERSMSTYLETGSVLIEAATDTEQVAAALATLAPLVPGLQYFRFNPEDERCGIELDDIDPVSWAALEAAADEYIAANDGSFDAAAKALCHKTGAKTAFESHRLGLRRDVLVVHAPQPTGEGPAAATTAIGTVAHWLFGSRHTTHVAVPGLAPQRQAGVQQQRQQPGWWQGPWRSSQQQKAAAPGRGITTSGQPMLAAAAAQATAAVQASSAVGAAIGEAVSRLPPAVPVVPPGGFAEAAASPSSPDTPLRGPAKKARLLRADGSSGSIPQASPSFDRQPNDSTLPEAAAEGLAAAARKHSDRVGIVHLALDTRGDSLVTSWDQELLADPSMEAEALLSEMTTSASDTEAPDSLAEVFTLGGGVVLLSDGDTLAMLGRQQQPLSGSLASSYLLLRGRPRTVASPSQVRSMAGAWEGKIVITTSRLSGTMVDALVAGGAKAVVGLSAKEADAEEEGCGEPHPEDAQAFFSALYNALLDGRSVEQAIATAEGQVPELAGRYTCTCR